MSSDERLVKGAKKGDQAAFAAIYKRYHQDLYRFCLSMVGRPEDAQDALQNTMIKAMRALPGEEREIRLKPWLYRIARNESIETLRKRRETATLVESQEAAGSGVVETAETRERLRGLLADLEQLPERQRAALVMRELSGLDFSEIADSFGTSPAVARQTLYEARLNLRHLEEGREMRCADVMRELSDADGRTTRRREIRSHLRSCTGCRGFRDGIARRQKDLSALAPLPLAASAGMLQALLGGKAAAGAAGVSGGLGGAVGATAGKVVATSAIVKSAATVAVVAAVGVSADRGGLVDLPLPGRDGPARSQSEPGPPGAGAGLPPAAADGPVAPDASGGEEKTEGKKGASGSANRGKQGGSRASRDSRSRAGLNPPGGGHGRSAAQRRGRPEGLPVAAGKGQQTAAAKKPPQPSNAGAPTGAGKPQAESAAPPEKSAGAKPSPRAPQPQGPAPPSTDSSPADGTGPPAGRVDPR